MAEDNGSSSMGVRNKGYGRERAQAGAERRIGQHALRKAASASSRAGQGTTTLRFRRGRSARVLDLRHYQVGDQGAQKLAETIRRHKGRIETLVLRENNIRGRGTIAICGALTTAHRCRKLDLARNRVGIDGCRALASALSTGRCGAVVPTLSAQQRRQIERRKKQTMIQGDIWRPYGHDSGIDEAK